MNILKKSKFPVFPLGLVVLPGTIQSLQIFEPRYIDMVKNCMQDNSGFVITLQSQSDGDIDFGIVKQGTYVEIIDFNNNSNGLLGITVKAINKVSIKDIVQQEDALHIAEVKPLIDPLVDDQALIAKHSELINILIQLKDHPRIKILPLDIDLTSADSVAYHLGGLIPLSAQEKQSILEAFDASQRMNILSRLITKLSEK
ncbi:LON peptidase substrate-binding domain-containing protein [Gammaproteobacteria bacterium]|nr:LON peptidase substrate-binding domain-containing protein [Gammaproteobacteria bacterium]MDB4059451.1 LON peptidase substrate-binding domain-containing protein [Gammaproteobacteria bacterium]MDB9996909.1 LON peptidase substrate-binding domain-containing protein [Gammaproteobacteria bacterium]MDC1190726.1 LON peptidase substrate-binding domain-containing protein [Gammaproteobacteria bacterium]